MPQTTEQNLSNHARYDPPYHFVLLPICLGIVILGVFYVIRHPYPRSLALWVILVSIALILAAFKARTFPLRAQDRLIRLEERIRLERLLPEGQRPLIAKLTEGQLIALRFASDAELPGLAQSAVDKQLPAAEIKKAIRSWRPDLFRV